MWPAVPGSRWRPGGTGPEVSVLKVEVQERASRTATLVREAAHADIEDETDGQQG
jgi:hypothetical protein